MPEMERGFKGIWIPKDVWLDDRLSALDKFILMEIDSLDSDETGCYASNKYIAEFCQCSETKVSKAISKLIEYGYLYVQSFDGRQRTLKSNILQGRLVKSASLVKNARQTSKKCEADKQKVQESNNNRETVIEKKERKKENYDSIIDEFVLAEDVKAALREFIKMRKLIKKPMTDRALKLLINRVGELATNEAEQVAIINQSIVNSWQNVYPLKDGNKKYGANGVQIADNDYDHSLDAIF